MNRLVDIHTHRPCDGVLCPTFEGVHPWHAPGAQIDHKAIAAADMVGETGLDYAADVMERIAGNTLMKEEHKAEKFRNVARALSLYNREIITTDETIKAILEA